MARKWHDITEKQLERMENRLLRVALNKKRREKSDDIWVVTLNSGHNSRALIEPLAGTWDRSLRFADRIESFLRANRISYRREGRCFDIRNWEIKKILSAELYNR